MGTDGFAPFDGSMVTRVIRNQRGLTLTEVMVALLIATIGMTGALAMLGTMVGSSNFSRSATEASTLVQTRIEEIQSYSSATLTAAQNTSEVVNALGQVVSGAPYTRTVTWTNDTTMAPLRIAAVAVSWNDALGTQHTISATTERIP